MEITYLIFLVLVFVLGIFHIKHNGGISCHIYFSYALSVYFLFLAIPSFFYWEFGTFEELGVSIKSVFEKGLLYYFLGLLCFVLGYIIKSANNERDPLVKIGLPLSDKVLIRITVFFIFLTGLLYLGNTIVNNSYLNYVLSTLDCLITLIIALYIRKVEKRLFVVLIALTIFIFSIYFFRYRIYLTMMGIGAVYIYHNQDFMRKFGRYLVIGTVMLYTILFFTINRNALASLAFDLIEYNVFNKDESSSVESIFVQQASNLHADFTVVKHFTENSTVLHDYGESMFVYPFIRAIPASFFINNRKPYPAPSMQLIIDAYGGDSRAEGAGRFVTNLIDFYIAFGLPGLIIGMFSFGFILRYLQDRWLWDGSYNSIIQIVIMVSLFQYISRGYIPQYLNHLFYLIAPIWLLRLLSSEVNTFHDEKMEFEDYSNIKSSDV